MTASAVENPIKVKDRFGALRSRVQNDRNLPVKVRKEYLTRLKRWIHANRKGVHDAMYADFKKPSAEVDGIELFHVLNEISYALSNLDRWVKPKKVDAPMTMLGTRSWIQYESKGICLIISPWNYPFSLCVGPLVSALAAGNRVIIKPSELTPNVSSLLRKMVDEIFPEEDVILFEGGPDVAQELLSLPFDHIFFTGSPAIGKVVMKAAAEHLTSVTLELGGKSPTIVTSSAHVTDAAQRTVVGKFVNNGQTCVAPDYVLVDEKVAPAFIAEVKSQLASLFAPGNISFADSKHYARIVNNRHFERLTGLLQDAVTKGATIEFGGPVNAEDRFIHPVILTQVARDSRILDEEIFGPILPVLTYKDIDEAITIVNSKPKALALYIFTSDAGIRTKILEKTSAGGVCVNDCGIHFLHHNLPFGGVNNSGMGSSHGHFGFLTFSHEKPVMKQRRGYTSVKAFYPPYTDLKAKIMDIFLKLF